jgi:TetR/AcrR family transcriptional repressor of nem operon
MGRPREFDEDEVLERALEVFWTHGYEGTSLADLMAATGLAKGSVYKGFGDKKSLFMRTLDMYLRRGRARYLELEGEGHEAIETLRRWLTCGVDLSTDSSVRKGCFSVNCMVELAPHDDEVRKLLREHEHRLEQLYERTLRRGLEAGTLRANLDPRAAARWLITVSSGVLVATKTGMTRKEALAMVDFTLHALRR